MRRCSTESTACYHTCYELNTFIPISETCNNDCNHSWRCLPSEAARRRARPLVRSQTTLREQQTTLITTTQSRHSRRVNCGTTQLDDPQGRIQSWRHKGNAKTARISSTMSAFKDGMRNYKYGVAHMANDRRKTGITLADRGIYDEHGLEPISGIFSSPEKSPPKRGGTITASESMDMQESTQYRRNPVTFK